MLRIEKEVGEKKVEVMPKNAFIFAVSPPTAGKTTQTMYLAETIGAEVVRGRDISPELAFDLATSRDLVPDDIFVPRLSEVLYSRTASQLVLDNIPRTRLQAETIVRWAEECGVTLHVIKLLLTEEEVVERVLGRLVCPECGESYHPELKPALVNGVCDRHEVTLIRRQGDTPELVRKGFRDHLKGELSIASVFDGGTAQVHEVSAMGTVNEAGRRLFAALSPAIFYKPEMATGYFTLRDVLEKHNLRHIFFSGMPVFMYGGRALMKDFDILVPDGDIERIASFLGKGVGEKHSSVADSRYVDIVPGVEINSDVVVKTEECGVRFDFDFLWHERQNTRFMGVPCQIMGLYDLILFKAALGRFGLDDWGKWKDDIADIEGLVGSQNVDWAILASRAKDLGMSKQYLIKRLRQANINLKETDRYFPIS